MLRSISTDDWKFVSLLGGPAAMAGLCLVLIVVLLLQQRWRSALACLLIDAGGGLLNVVLKELVHRPRPPGAELVLGSHSWSFPSGHAMGATIGYGTLTLVVWLVWSLARPIRWVVLVGAVTAVLAIGVSRVALGVHYPGDVAGGWVIGLGCLGVGTALLRRAVVADATEVARSA